MAQALADTAGGIVVRDLAARAYSSRRRTLRVAVSAATPFFLVPTIARRLNPFARPSQRGSIMGEARMRAAAIVPFIFMG